MYESWLGHKYPTNAIDNTPSAESQEHINTHIREAKGKKQKKKMTVCHIRLPCDRIQFVLYREDTHE